MDNDTTQPFQPAPFPTFEDQGPIPPAASEQLTRRRKSRRSSATPAASSPTSSAERPKRKYTRRTPSTPAPSRKPVEVPATPFAELEFVTETVATLRALDPKTRARVMTAIGRLLA